MKVVSKLYPNDPESDYEKCNRCNWSVSVRFSFEGEDIDERGLCGECFMDMIVENDYEVTRRSST